MTIIQLICYFLLFVIIINSISVSISLLVVNTQKYENIQGIKEYLKNVYPTIDTNKSDKDYYILYNKLGWYYHCCGEPNTYINDKGIPIINTIIPKNPYNIDTTLKQWPIDNWVKLGCCSDKFIPKIPNGIFYDWYSWQYFNVPIIVIKDNKWGYSEFNKLNKEKFVNIKKTRGGTKNTNYTNILGSQLVSNFPKTSNWSTGYGIGQQLTLSEGSKPGPSPFMAGTRNLMRYPYHPYGIQNNLNGKWTINGKDLFDINYLFSHIITKYDMHNISEPYGYYKNYWADGYKEGDYIEVSHTGRQIGLIESTGFWVNHFPPNGGTGNFYKIGKTPKMIDYNCNLADIDQIVPRNKVALLFTLLVEVKNSKKLPNVGSALADKIKNNGQRRYFKNGSDYLKYLYGTDDPYTIVWYHCEGFTDELTPDKKQRIPLNNYAMSSNGYEFVDVKSWAVKNAVIPDGQPGNLFLKNTFMLDGGSQLGYMNNLSYQAYSYYALKTYFKGKIPHDFLDGTYPNYYTNTGLNPVWYQNGFKLSYKARKYILDLAFKSNWFFDRVADGVAFDEPMNYFGTILGYETLQMTMDPTGNGIWGYEIIDIRFPEDTLQTWFKNKSKTYPKQWKNWKSRVIKNRQWTSCWVDPKTNSHLNPIGVSSCYGLAMTQFFLTQRDPFDIDNNNKIMDCNKSGVLEYNKYNCKIVGNISDIYDGMPDTDNIKLNLINDSATYIGICKTSNPDSIQSSLNLNDWLNNRPKEVQNLVWVDTINNLCYPNWSNNISISNLNKLSEEEQKTLSNWDSFGSLYCLSSNKLPYSAYWGNIDYNNNAMKPGDTKKAVNTILN